MGKQYAILDIEMRDGYDTRVYKTHRASSRRGFTRARDSGAIESRFARRVVTRRGCHARFASRRARSRPKSRRNASRSRRVVSLRARRKRRGDDDARRRRHRNERNDATRKRIDDVRDVARSRGRTPVEEDGDAGIIPRARRARGTRRDDDAKRCGRERWRRDRERDGMARRRVRGRKKRRASSEARTG